MSFFPPPRAFYATVRRSLSEEVLKVLAGWARARYLKEAKFDREEERHGFKVRGFSTTCALWYRAS